MDQRSGARPSGSRRRRDPRRSRSPAALASRIQPTQTSTGRKARTNVPAERRSRSPFVQPTTTCARAITSPAPATIAIAAQKRPTDCVPTWVATQSRSPATPADDGRRQAARRVVESVPPHPIHLIRSSRVMGGTDDAAAAEFATRAPADVRRSSTTTARRRIPRTVRSASSAKRCSTTPTSRSLWNGTSTCGCETRLSESRAAVRAADGEPDRALAGGEERERRREDRPRARLRDSRRSSTATPPPRSARRRDRRARTRRGSTRDVIRLRNVARGEPERRPVELVVADEPVVLVPAAAHRSGRGRPPDVRSRERSIRRNADRGTCVSPRARARERVAAREHVVHAEVVDGAADGATPDPVLRRRLVMRPVTLPGSWVVSTERCKDAGSAHSRSYGRD